jgi:hypothetical protein
LTTWRVTPIVDRRGAGTAGAAGDRAAGDDGAGRFDDVVQLGVARVGDAPAERSPWTTLIRY